MKSEECAEDVGDEHGGGFLDVVAAGMEEGIESELGTAGEVEAFWTPRHIAFGESTAGTVPLCSGVEADAYRGLFVEGSHEAVEAIFAHQQPRLTDEIFR